MHLCRGRGRRILPFCARGPDLRQRRRLRHLFDHLRFRHHLVETVAELLTSLAYPNDWWVRLQDYQAGFTLEP